MAIESYFEDIADAIRERGGTSATLTPAAMPQAILDIPGGGSGGMLYHKELSPIKTDLSSGYISSGLWYPSGSGDNKVDVYEVVPGNHYFIHLGNTVSTRFRCGLFATDPTVGAVEVTGRAPSYDNNAPNPLVMIRTQTETLITVGTGFYYLVIQKTNVGANGINSYVVEFNENGYS